jgi:hypothetical protein
MIQFCPSIPLETQMRTNCLYKLNFGTRVRRWQMSADMAVAVKARAEGSVCYAFPDAEEWTYIMI